ncbi:MAG: transporter substrate-binding domain-containing protein [Desulfobacterales bacterium]|nr:transporter substrate-binding domain-containing protein [Desulfobacterales bacterium]
MIGQYPAHYKDKNSTADNRSPFSLIPPYHFVDGAGRETGFIIEIITRVSSAMGRSVTFEQYPWSRCLRMMKSGEADAMMNLFKTPEREAFGIMQKTFWPGYNQ